MKTEITSLGQDLNLNKFEPDEDLNSTPLIRADQSEGGRRNEETSRNLHKIFRKQTLVKQ